MEHPSLSAPLEAVHQAMLATVGTDAFESDWGVPEHFQGLLADPAVFAQIPAINHVALHSVAPNSLVRLRVMVQDMFEPQLYVTGAVAVNSTTGERVPVTSRYQDYLSTPNESWVITDDAIDTKALGSRLRYHCVPVPHETDWATAADAALFASEAALLDRSVAEDASPVRAKRVRRDETDEASSDGDVEMPSHAKRNRTNAAAAAAEAAAEAAAVAAAVDAANAAAGVLRDGGSVIGGPVAPALSEDGAGGRPVGARAASAIVYFYDTDSGPLLNDMIEVVGVLTVDPEGTRMFSAEDAAEEAFYEEALAHSPPGSLVARVHALYYRKLAHGNPLVTEGEGLGLALAAVRDEIPRLRGQLTALFGAALGYDALAAEYLLLALVARVHLRSETLVLGRFSLNLCGLEPESPVPAAVYELLCGVLPRVAALTVSIPALNAQRLFPRKDYVTNQLVGGALQLARGTLVLLDETGLTEGTLDDTGVRNERAVRQLLDRQSVPYDFSFQEQVFEADAPAVVFSCQRSIFETVATVPLVPTDGAAAGAAAAAEPAGPESDAEFAAAARVYLGLARWLNFALDDPISQQISADFVELRQQMVGADGVSTVTQESLHNWIATARLLAISHGETSLSPARWEQLKELERARFARLA